LISVLYEGKIIAFSVVTIEILVGVFSVLYYFIIYGHPKKGNKKWESQKAYTTFYASMVYIFGGLVIIALFAFTKFLYDKNIDIIETLTIEIFSCLSLPVIGISIGNYFRAKKFGLTFKHIILNIPKK
jgi:heme/copper-type cytochrome/quinol oxidase subunit 2